MDINAIGVASDMAFASIAKFMRSDRKNMYAEEANMIECLIEVAEQYASIEIWALLRNACLLRVENYRERYELTKSEVLNIARNCGVAC